MNDTKQPEQLTPERVEALNEAWREFARTVVAGFEALKEALGPIYCALRGHHEWEDHRELGHLVNVRRCSTCHLSADELEETR